MIIKYNEITHLSCCSKIEEMKLIWLIVFIGPFCEPFKVLPRKLAVDSVTCYAGYSDKDNDKATDVSERRKKRYKSTKPDPKLNINNSTVSSRYSADSDPGSAPGKAVARLASPPPKDSPNTASEDGTTSLEDLFGLSPDQLVDLSEDELPVPREDLVTGRALQEEDGDANKVFQLPDLNEFMKENREQSSSRRRKEDGNNVKIDRRNEEEYMRVMQLNPFADADESLFLDEVRV
jgi:hypothetical protein